MVTYTELALVLKDMKNRKTSGTDGFTVEFYKFFWGDIGQILLESLNEALAKRELSITQKQGIITLRINTKLAFYYSFEIQCRIQPLIWCFSN